MASADFGAVDRVRRAIEEDPVVAGRLALWGRRIVGEALAQAQTVVALSLRCQPTSHWVHSPTRLKLKLPMVLRAAQPALALRLLLS